MIVYESYRNKLFVWGYCYMISIKVVIVKNVYVEEKNIVSVIYRIFFFIVKFEV